MLAVTCPASLAGPEYAQPSTDMVPRGCWQMDALAWLAGEGLLPPFTARDFLQSRTFTRLEIAEILRNAQIPTEPRASALYSRLRDELSEELVFLGVQLEDNKELGRPSAADQTVLTGWVSAIVSRADGDSRGFSTGTLTAVSIPGPRRVLNATLTSEARLFHPDSYQRFPALDRFSFAENRRTFKWDVGRSYSWFGTAGAGSMWLSDASPALFKLRASGVLDLGRPGRWALSWQTGAFSDRGRTVYLLSRRVQKTLSPKWTLGYIDMSKTTRTPDPLMAVLPALAYQSLFLKDVDSKWNALLGVEAIYRPSPRTDTYLQWMVDDMTSPLASRHDAPKKTGILVGLRTRSADFTSGGLRLQAEYCVIDARAYEATRPGAPLLAWTQDGLPLAWSYGPDSRTLALRAEKRFSQRWDCAATLVDSRKKSGPGRNTVLSLQPSWDFDSRSSLSLILEWRSGDVDETSTGIRASVAF
ncbi:MAG: hypothetical protein KatS3mg024_1050 [Armatimonadota bacterium]|nr:MAG: hypothetical protein KatS3mg024_1050 [Armatimonadota bacterium]